MRDLAGIRVVSRIVTLVVLVASGVYVFLYLYRWEWNRALMAGVFFVAAEVALIGATVMTRLRAIEQHVGTAPGSGGVGSEPAAPRAVPGTQARRPFAWLDEVGGGFGVFIPILLGAGVILSLVAWVVERLARYVTAPLADGGHIAAFGALDLPVAPLAPGPGDRDLDLSLDPGPEHGAARGRRLLHGLVVVGTVVLLLVGVGFLREAAESRPDAGEGGSTTLLLEVSTRETGSTTQQIVDALWIACRLRLPPDAELLSARVVGPGEAELVVAPSLGRTDHRKFVGCLEDAVLDRVVADVTAWQSSPTPAG
jgi:hypothetical protein